jgi:hypothetical protein
MIPDGHTLCRLAAYRSVCDTRVLTLTRVDVFLLCFFSLCFCVLYSLLFFSHFIRGPMYLVIRFIWSLGRVFIASADCRTVWIMTKQSGEREIIRLTYT